MRIVMVLTLSLFIAGPLAAEEKEKPAKKVHMAGKPAEAVPAADLKWMPAPGMPEGKGPQLAVLWGDPMKGGYGTFAKFAPDTHHPLHTHPNMVRVVIVSGTFLYGDEGQEPKELGPGSYLMVPGGHKHVSGCKAGAECVLFQSGTAKFGMKPAGGAA